MVGSTVGGTGAVGGTGSAGDGVDPAGGGGASTGVSVELLGDALALGGAGVSEGDIPVQAVVASNDAAPAMISLVLMMTTLSC